MPAVQMEPVAMAVPEWQEQLLEAEAEAEVAQSAPPPPPLLAGMAGMVTAAVEAEPVETARVVLQEQPVPAEEAEEAMLLRVEPGQPAQTGRLQVPAAAVVVAVKTEPEEVPATTARAVVEENHLAEVAHKV